MNLATFLLILAILGIIIGVLNKGARVIAFFVAMMAIVLLIGTPGNQSSNFFANLLSGNQTAQTPATQAPNTTQPYYDPNTGAVISPNPTSNGNPGTNSNTGSPAQGSGGDLTSQPFTDPQRQAQAPQPAQPGTPAGQVPPGNNSTITNNTGSRTSSSSYPYVPPRRALW